MSFLDFPTSNVKSVRVTSQTIEGEGASSVVVACVLEIEQVNGDLTEIDYTFEDGHGYNLASFQALIGALSRHLGSD